MRENRLRPLVIISYYSSYLVEDDDNFILVSPEIVKTKWALVLYKYRLNQVEAVPDRAEPRILFVSIATNPYIDLQLYFEDHTLS